MTLGNYVSVPLTSGENLLTIRGWKMASNICHHVRKKGLLGLFSSSKKDYLP